VIALGLAASMLIDDTSAAKLTSMQDAACGR